MAHYNHKLKKWFKSKKSSSRAERAIWNWRKNQKSTIIELVFALIIQLILIFYKVPSKEDAYIMLLKAIIPFSTSWFITLIAIIMQLATIFLIYDSITEIHKRLKSNSNKS